MSFIWFIIAYVLGLFTRNLLPSYFKEKGKNLATKEDISEITKKIEIVKIDYAKQLESAKAELAAQINTHGFRYEKEYEVLNELSALLIDVRDACLSLRPIMDFKDPTKKEDEIKRERLIHLHETGMALYEVREKKRSFYPDEIYQAILLVEKAAQTESIEYKYGDPWEGKKFKDYWEKAQQNQKKIADKVNAAIEKIRARVIKWDTLG